jgi:hypothetical protein
MRLRPALFALLAGIALIAGCAAPATTAATQAAPATAAPSPAPVTPVKLDTRCTSDAQCVVRNVGSCCGELPACVNADSPTDPAAVQAQCRASGRVGICGFRPTSACQCQAGTCVPADDGPAPSHDPAAAPAPVR